MKKVFWVSVVLPALVFFVMSDAFCMGWFQPPPASPVDPGPVSSPEPGVVTLVGMAVSAGVGYLFGRRKK
jgi:hypothetical protein